MANLLSSILKMSCPNCRKGFMFSNKSVFPLKQLQDMPERCSCGQKMMPEVGFYYGTGFVSYGLCILISGLVFGLYALLFGVSVQDNSLFYFIGIDILILILMMPVLIRYSRVLYLYIFVRKGSYIPSNAGSK